MILLSTEPIDLQALESAVSRPGAGALCSFQGLVRDHNIGRSVLYLEYEAFTEMALAAMRQIAEEARERWPEVRVALVHRLGRLEIGEASVAIAVSSPHRAESFEACRWAIDTLKTRVPIWKKEVFAGGEAWVEGVAVSPLDASPFAEPEA
jgi:molybdopterin synthase catalytic subunit